MRDWLCSVQASRFIIGDDSDLWLGTEHRYPLNERTSARDARHDDETGQDQVRHDAVRE